MNEFAVATNALLVPARPPAENAKAPSRTAPRVAVIPAAGRGRRLDRITTPKPLVEVGGEPLLVRNLKHLQRNGVERAIVIVGYRGDEVQRALFRHSDIDMDVQCIDNDHWEQGLISSILCAREHVHEPFVLAMADHVFTPETAAEFLTSPLHAGDIVSVLGDSTLASKRELQTPVMLRVDGHMVVDTGRGTSYGDVVDAGLFLARPALFDALQQSSDRGCNDLCEAIRVIAMDGQVRWADVNERAWFDVDTPSDLILAEMALRKRQPYPVDRDVAAPSLAPSNTYAFSTGHAVRTDIIVDRGFVRDPRRFRLIPAESDTSPIYVFTDTRVNALYGDVFVDGLTAAGHDVRRVVMAEGESSKSLENFKRVADQVITEGIDERSIIISLGGGAVCNVAGFLASTLYRGIGLIHIPTTVMAQCDAAISHKQAINGARGKNQIGAYYAPKRIVVDIDALSTLEPWRVSDGLAEVIKHALAQDPDLLEFLLSYSGDQRDPSFLERVIRRNIELKCLLVSQDPKEEREGLVLHYGHTVGHAVEYLSGFDLGHGQAVAIGMMAAARVSRLMGCCDDAVVELHRDVLQKFGLPTEIPEDIETGAIVEMMRYNKRYLVEGTRFALVGEAGRLCQVEGHYAVPVSNQILGEALRIGR